MDSLRAHLTYANVMATVAVFIALGGSSYAAIELARNSVGSKHIRNNAVKSRDVANGTIRAVDVRDRTLTHRDVRDRALRGRDMATNTVGTRIIRDGTLLARDFARGELPAFQEVQAGGDLTGSFPDPRLRANAVEGDDVADGSLTGADIADGSLDGEEIDDNSLGGDDVDETSLFNDNSLTTDDIDDSTLFNDNSLTTDDIDDSTLFNDNSLNGGDIAPDSIGGSAVDESTLTGFDRAQLGPRAYARVSGPGAISDAVGFAGIIVTRPQTGQYCFILPFAPKNVQVTPEGGISDHLSAVAQLGSPPSGCPDEADFAVFVHNWSSSVPVDGPFFLAIN